MSHYEVAQSGLGISLCFYGTQFLEPYQVASWQVRCGYFVDDLDMLCDVW